MLVFCLLCCDAARGELGASCLAAFVVAVMFVEPLTRALAAYSAREPAHLSVGNRAHVQVRGLACGRDG